jgi:hypothetical protein
LDRGEEEEEEDRPFSSQENYTKKHVAGFEPQFSSDPKVLFALEHYATEFIT